MRTATGLRCLAGWGAAVACLVLLPLPAAAVASGAGAAPPAAAPLPAPPLPFSFETLPYELAEIPLAERPLSNSLIAPREDTGLHDEQGVRMQLIDGVVYEWPRGQANYGLENLNSYRLTGDPFYLDRCIAQARRLVSYHAEADDGAWYYPTYPSRSRHGRPGEWIEAPYYSSLAEGRILMLLARLAQVTGRQEWYDAAGHTFAAFLRPGPVEGPYVVNVDAGGFFWLQEWPWAGMEPDCTLNGHVSAAFGIYEYYVVTRDDRAGRLFRGAATTVRQYLPQFRRPGWVSCYCLLHRSANPNYHEMHIDQLRMLHQMTGDAAFARAADAFRADFPRPDVAGLARIGAGTWRVVRVDDRGVVTARRTIHVRHAVTRPTTSRQRLRPKSRVHLRIASGRAAGWWIAECAGRVFLRGASDQVGYLRPRTLVVDADRSLVAVLYGEDWSVVERVPVESGTGLRLAVDRRAVIDGQDRVRVLGGELDRCWLRLGDGVRLR